MPRVDDLLTRFQSANFFSVLDAASGFWTVPMEENSIAKTAFITKRGLFEFLRMPFGLTNAPATFQRYMEKSLLDQPRKIHPEAPPDTKAGPLLYTCSQVYMDDVIGYSPTWEQHLLDLEAIFQAFIANGVSARLDKCVFGQPRVKYLGYVISRTGISPNPEKIKAIQDFPRPTNLESLRSALGTFGHYRKLVRNFSQIAEPLTRLTKQRDDLKRDRKGVPAKKVKQRSCFVPFEWGPQQEAAFQTLKQALTTAPILGHPDFRQRFYLQTDASDIGLGAVLSQFQGEKSVVIAYWSQLLSKTERKYSATEREGLAIVRAIQHFRSYLAGRPFTVVTDHAALRYLMSAKDPTNRIARWVMYLQQYDFTIEHRPGRASGNADGLSRAPVNPAAPEEEATRAATVMAAFALSNPSLPLVVNPTQQIRELQWRDPVLRAYITYLRDGNTLANVDPASASLLLDLDDFALVDGLLYHRPPYRLKRGARQPRDLPSRPLQLVVPPQLRPAILRGHHESVLAAHGGITATYESIRLRYWWRNLLGDVVAYVKSCTSCAAVKPNLRGQASGYLPHSTKGQYTRPFEAFGMDFLGPLPATQAGNTNVLVVMDYFTRWCEAFALPDATAVTTAKVLLNQIFLRFGPPRLILSDQGPHFTAEMVRVLMELFSINQHFSSGYRPQTAGLVERMNATLTDMLAHYVGVKQDDWDLFLPYVIFAYNTTYRESIKETPFYLLYGYQPVLPDDLYLLPNDLANSAALEHRNAAAGRWNQARALAQDHLRKAQERQRQGFDSKHPRPHPFRVGDLVFMDKPYVLPGTSPKLSKAFQGPYKVLGVLSSGRTLRLQRLSDGDVRLSHVDNLKPFTPSDRLRPNELPSPSQPPRFSDELVARTVDNVDRVLRGAVRVVPAERLRAIMHHAFQDPDAAIPQPVPGLPSRVQPLEEFLRQLQAPAPSPPTRAAEMQQPPTPPPPAPVLPAPEEPGPSPPAAESPPAPAATSPSSAESPLSATPAPAAEQANPPVSTSGIGLLARQRRPGRPRAASAAHASTRTSPIER